jgi:phosphopantothenoylcysteine decarboxylase/phosphopantothenate--cysteine ligase
MGSSLATAALERGFEVTIVSGPVQVDYPDGATVISVCSAAEMLEQVLKLWPDFDGMIAAAAPSDFRPKTYSESKLKKTDDDGGMTIEFVKNPDILAAAGKAKSDSQWTVGFALETENGFENAFSKLRKKNCDYIVLNDPSAIDAGETKVAIIDRTGKAVDEIAGAKTVVAERIVRLISN